MALKSTQPCFRPPRTKRSLSIMINSFSLVHNSCFSGFTDKLGLAAISLSISPEDALSRTEQTDRLQALISRIQRPLNACGGLVPLLDLSGC